jgi:hypothetical protein
VVVTATLYAPRVAVLATVTGTEIEVALKTVTTPAVTPAAAGVIALVAPAMKLVPVMVRVVVVLAAPRSTLVGMTPVMVGAAGEVMVKLLALVAVPPVVVTATL